MKIYTFGDKTFQQRIDEFILVLDDCTGTSIRDEWRDFLSVSIEPAYYTAIWKLSRGMCELHNIIFPTEVYGKVENTDFDDLTVDFRVERVQDDQIQLPEVCQVPLDEIFPTVQQEYSTLNVEATADIIDRYRFFYNFIFLPFDSDEEKDFAKTKLLSRVQLLFDLKNKQLSKAMSAYVRQLITEMKEIQFNREILNNSIADDDEQSESQSETVAKLLELHLQMNKMKHEFEIIVNRDMRGAYELIKFGRKVEDFKQTYLLTTSGPISEHVELLEKLKERIPSDTMVNWTTSLADAVARAPNDSEIYIPTGDHTFSFMDYLNGNILLCGISETSPFSAIKLMMMNITIDDDVRFENLEINCRNVKTGFMIKGGSVSLKKCKIIGSGQAGVSEAFNLSGESKLTLIDCTIFNFSTAIDANEASCLKISNSSIDTCGIGICIMGDAVKTDIENVTVANVSGGEIIKYSERLETGFKDICEKAELEEYGITLTNCSAVKVKIYPKLTDDEEEEEDEAMDD